jgi:hypothetical protein
MEKFNNKMHYGFPDPRLAGHGESLFWHRFYLFTRSQAPARERHNEKLMLLSIRAIGNQISWAFSFCNEGCEAELRY